MEKGSSTKNQPSPGVSKEAVADKYSTYREDIAEVAITAIQTCPIIPDFKEPTVSTLPIIAQTPAASFCIDGWNFIEQARAAGRATIRCHVYHIAHHSIIELAIRKVAIRIMPQGGKCSYAESIRNAHRLFHSLLNTSDNLVLFSHGGDRRGVGFTESKANNIRVVLVDRLGKSPTTVNKYLQHGEFLNDATMEELVDAGAPKQFFEAVQTPKEIRKVALQADGKDEAAIVSDISDQVSAWWEESQRPVPPKTTPSESPQPPQARRPTAPTLPSQSQNQPPTASIRAHQERSDISGNPATGAPPTTGEAGVTAELKRIGEALIEIADSQESSTPQQVETIRRLIQELAVLHQRLVQPSEPERSGNGGTV